VKTVAVSSSLKETPALEESSEKGSEKSSEKILSLVRMESTLSAREIAFRLGITPRAVEKQITMLRKDGRLKRAGPAKGGHWDVIDS
jgi:ATP-dependent DNA helicase RecG